MFSPKFLLVFYSSTHFSPEIDLVKSTGFQVHGCALFAVKQNPNVYIKKDGWNQFIF